MDALFRSDRSILIIFSFISLLVGWGTPSPTLESLSLMGWICMFQFLYSIISWIKKGNQLLSPYIIFLITLYVFSTGQSFLWALGFESKRTLIGFYGVTIDEIFKAQIFTQIMLAFFQIGASTFMAKILVIRIPKETIVIDSNKLKKVGWILFIISVMPYSQMIIMRLLLSLSQGYGALFELEEKVGFDNLGGFIADYFIPSIICLFIAYRKNKPMRSFITIVLIVNIIAILITGGRSNAVILIALLLVMYNYLVRKFERKTIFLGIFGAFFLLQILAYVGSARSEHGRSSNFNELKFEDNAAIDAIAEMGSTMFCLIKTQNLVPDKFDYKYGKSYAYSFATLIPNIGIWEIHPAKKESNLSNWLTETLGLSFGTGYSMCAEAYINFGYFCFVAFFFWGYFLANIFGKIEFSAKTGDLATLAFLLILFWFFLKLPRNNFINLVRPIFFVAGPIYLYCNNFKFKRS